MFSALLMCLCWVFISHQVCRINLCHWDKLTCFHRKKKDVLSSNRIKSIWKLEQFGVNSLVSKLHEYFSNSCYWDLASVKEFTFIIIFFTLQSQHSREQKHFTSCGMPCPRMLCNSLFVCEPAFILQRSLMPLWFRASVAANWMNTTNWDW